MDKQQKQIKNNLSQNTDTDGDDPLNYKEGYYILIGGTLDIVDKLAETISTKEDSEVKHILSEVREKLMQLHRDAEYACTEPLNE